MPSRPRNIWIDDELWRLAKLYAYTHGWSAAYVVHRGLRRYLESQGDASVKAAIANLPPLRDGRKFEQHDG